jgi:hypothetical protein
MGKMSNPFANARIERYTHSRRHAQTVVETALLVCEVGAVSDSQLVDLAGAVDALRSGQFQAATILAEAAIEGRSRMRTVTRPPGMTHSIAELWTVVANLSTREALPSVGQGSTMEV